MKLRLLDRVKSGGTKRWIFQGYKDTEKIYFIFITARHNEDDRLHGYKLGCDDYVSKPFSLAELYAKVTALLKRSEGMVSASPAKDIHVCPLVLTANLGARGDIIVDWDENGLIHM